MQVKLLAFATAAERLGWREMLAECSPDETPREVLLRVAPDFAPSSVRVAVNCEYRPWDEPIGAEARELAVLPPVSGG
jgi:molybdopterin converting factor small subunit